MVKICKVAENSAAQGAGILAGDELLRINSEDIADAFDYRYYLAERLVTLTLLRDGREFDVTISKNEYEDIGLEFETPLMDEKHSCRNKCIFCFIDQLPSGLRESLYFKDDDSRLSFLHGNYITLTNMTDADIDRIIKMHLSPINISVHTTNPELRCRMMNNRFAGKSLAFLDRLRDGGAKMNAQIVLCRGINDGDELLRTLTDLGKYFPALETVSVVPAGLTKYREGLYPLSPYSAHECREIIKTVEKFAAAFHRRHGTYFVWCSDELYLKAGKKLPKYRYYENFTQYNNGVGMLSSLEYEFCDYLYGREHDCRFSESGRERRVSIATGAAAYDTVKRLSDEACRAFDGLHINVYRIVNRFFGEDVTVTGLLTGKDISEQLAGMDLGEELLLSSNTVSADGSLFLCGMTPAELEEKLGVHIRFTDEGKGGTGLAEAILGETPDGENPFNFRG